MMHTQTVYIPLVEREMNAAFREVYDPYVFHGTAEFLKSSLRVNGQRICRFCKKHSPDVRFKNDAHIIPNLLGNRHYLWTEECDSCNELFGKFETHLSTFLGIQRTFSDIKGGEKYPTFTSQDAGISARRLDEDLIFINRNDPNKGFQFKEEASTSTLSIDISRKAFIPAYVYNSFLKIALSVLPADDVPDYSMAYQYLLDIENYDNLKGPRQVRIAESNVSYDTPFAVLFQKKIKDPVYPIHTLCLYVQNLMFQIAFPFHKDEISITPKKTVELPAPYVDMTGTMVEPITVRRALIDLHSTEKFKDAGSALNAKFDNEVLKNLVGVKLPDDFMKNLLK
jgi:hypothetical protein